MWRIKHWDQHFENNKSREVADARWVPVKNKQDGDGYLSLIEPVDGVACYGAFMAVVLLASRCKPRGLLVQSNGLPHTPETIARKTHVPAALIHKALQRCAEPKVDWVEWIPDADAADLFAGGDAPPGKAPERPPERHPSADASSEKGSGSGIGKESSPPLGGEEDDAASGPSPLPAGEEIGFACQGKPNRWVLTAPHLDQLQVAWPGVRVRDCLDDLRQRQAREPSLMRTARGMPQYLHNWLRSEAEKVRRFLVEPGPAAAGARDVDRNAKLAEAILTGKV